FRDSVRARGIPFEVASHWSMPPIRVAELINPQLLGDAEGENLQDFWGVGVYGKVRRPFFLSIYPGLLIAIGVATGIIRRVRGTAFFVTTAALSILFAAGEHTPLLRWAHDAGIAGAVRYPEKFIILGIFAGIVYAARPLDALFSGDRAVLRVARIIAAVIFAATSALALLGTTRFHEPLFRAVWRVPQGLEAGGMLAASQSGWMRSAAAALVLLLLLAAMPRLRRSLAIVLAGIFVVAELGSLSTRIAPRAPAAFYDPPPAVGKLPPNRDDYRVFHLAAEQRGEFADAYLRPQPDGEWLVRNAMTPYFPAAYGIRLVLGGDFDLTNLLVTDDLAAAMADFSNVSDEWVTPMAAMSNAQYVVLFRDPRLAFAEGRGEMRAVQPIEVRHAGAFPRYYFARQIVTIRDGRDLVQRLASKRHPLSTAFIHEAAFTPAPARVTRVSETTQSARIDVEARGRALLVMSVTPHKYWRITIDGAETQAMVTNLGYQSVVVPAGRHVVEMRYRNPLIAAGGAVSAAALLGLLLFARRGAPRPARED
ncbi:MAG TPA: hypothetical protein VFO89_03275, partial [Thermoanaerobaculia bacterium]|nr:hypothetical protein [Thermoanaerobaculia bacterium]